MTVLMQQRRFVKRSNNSYRLVMLAVEREAEYKEKCPDRRMGDL